MSDGDHSPLQRILGLIHEFSMQAMIAGPQLRLENGLPIAYVIRRKRFLGVALLAGLDDD